MKLRKLGTWVAVAATCYVSSVAVLDVTLAMAPHHGTPAVTTAPVTVTGLLTITCDASGETTAEVDGRTITLSCPSAGIYRIDVDADGVWHAVPTTAPVPTTAEDIVTDIVAGAKARGITLTHG